MYQDRTLTCSDCSQSFVFTERDQAFYAERGFSEPRRCPSCRAARKAQRDSGGGGYASGGGYSSTGGYSAGGYADRGPRQTYTATCSNCGNEARLPFKPTNGKPVYCSDCFRSIRGA